MGHSVLNLYKELNMTINDYTGIFKIGPTWELSITGTWTGVVSVLRRFNSTDDWGVVQTYTENIEDSTFFKGHAIVEYMVVVGTAGTGTAKVRCFR